jgi:predicted aspartyl protease
MSVPFNPSQGLIIVSAIIFGPQGNRAVRLALDTAATETVISRRVLVNIGVDILAAPSVSVVMGGGVVSVPLVTLDKMETLGQTQMGLTIQAHTLPSSLPIDGLLGLDFIRKYRLVVDFRTGRIALT